MTTELTDKQLIQQLQEKLAAMQTPVLPTASPAISGQLHQELKILRQERDDLQERMQAALGTIEALRREVAKLNKQP